MSKFIVEYVLPYDHVVRVGVDAKDGASAVALAQEAFSQGTIWDNTAEMPLLYDDYEETGDLGVPVNFKMIEECATWPEPGVCVKSYVQGQAAKRACEWLIQAFGSRDSSTVREALLQVALEEAFAAMPYLDVAQTSMRPIGAPIPPTAVIGVDGGVVQWVASDRPVQYVVLDFDTDGSGDRRIKVTMENGDIAAVNSACAYMADQLPEWIPALLKEVEAEIQAD